MSTSMRIRDLVQARLAGRKIDVVNFVEELLDLASETGVLRCSWVSGPHLHFELGDETCDAELDAAQGKLRMLCARLSAMSGTSPYGGEGTFTSCTKGDRWLVRIKNTPDEHEFMIAPAALPAVGLHDNSNATSASR